MDNLSSEEIQLRAHQVTDEVNILLGISNFLLVFRVKGWEDFLRRLFWPLPSLFISKNALALECRY